MPEEIEEWLDDVVSCGVWVADTVQQVACYLVLKVVRGRGEAIDDDKAPDVPTKPETLDKFICLKEIHTFLETLQLPKALSHSKHTGFLQQASGDTLVVCIDMGAWNFSDLPLINITEIMSI